MNHPEHDLAAGMKATLPLVVGAIPFGIIFGTLAAAGGLSFSATMAMSLFVFAGSAQFIALGLLSTGTIWQIVILTTFVVNLRHLLYAAALVPYVKNLKQITRIGWGFTLTDETFAVVMSRARDPEKQLTSWYYFGSAGFMYANWQLCTLLGFTAGQVFPNIAKWGLDFAMPVTFIGMLLPYLKTRPMVFAVIVAGISAVALHGFPHKLGLILASLFGVGVGLGLETFNKKTAAHE